MYLVFTGMPGESYHRRLRSLLLHFCYVFRALINSLVRWFVFSCFIRDQPSISVAVFVPPLRTLVYSGPVPATSNNDVCLLLKLCITPSLFDVCLLLTLCITPSLFDVCLLLTRVSHLVSSGPMPAVTNNDVCLLLTRVSHLVSSGPVPVVSNVFVTNTVYHT